MAPGLTGERRAVIGGIVLGEDERLSEPLRDDFKASGLYHLLAVSGQNVAYVVGGILLAAWVAGVRRRIAHLAALAGVLAYTGAVGWQPSVVRAGVAGLLVSLAWLASRPSDRWYFLLVGAAVLLAVNPYTLLEPGFQLSFVAVAAIFVVVPRIERQARGLSAAAEGRPGPRALDRLRPRHGARALAPLRRDPGLHGARECARRAGRPAPARVRARSARCSIPFCRRPRSRSPG